MKLVLGAAALLIAFVAGSARAQSTEFVAFGDIPYGDDQIASVQFIGRALRAGGYPFVVHYGDIKGGGTSCADRVLTERRELVFGLLAGRVVFTPGDNDWTDCDRPAAGGFDELERLDRLRGIFFADDAAADLNAARQLPDYPENARWRHDGIQFVTLHIVGTDNGRREVLRSDVGQALAAVARRDRANLDWLTAAFDEAADAPAVVVIIHADPLVLGDRKQRNQACTGARPVACNPYLAFLERLTVLADAFDGPVLLIHGSSSSFCLDAGFGGWRAPKLWRLNGPGDYVSIDAAVVRVEPAARTPFRVHALLSGDTVPACTPR